MKKIFDLTQGQRKTLTLLSMVILTGGGYSLVRDYYLQPSEPSHDLQERILERYRTPFVLDVNASPADSLELVPGIGPVLAMRIIEYRKAHGRFVSVDSLVHVVGIGPATLKKIGKYLKVSHP